MEDMMGTKIWRRIGLREAEFGHDAIFPVHAFTAGFGYDLFTIRNTKIAAGGQLTLYSPGKPLTSLYGDTPLAGQIYLRIYPRVMGKKAGRFYLPY